MSENNAAQEELAEVPQNSNPSRVSKLKLCAYTVFILFMTACLFFALDENSREYVQRAWQHRNQTPQARRPRGSNPLLSFSLFNTSIPRNRIAFGGVHKDGIPALTNPPMLEAEQVDYLKPDDRIIGFVSEDEARAYPIRILNYHEIVNDVVNSEQIAVTYCPLCDSSLIFDRNTELGIQEFGVSGLIYNSNLLMYNRAKGDDPRNQIESLWSQVKAKGVSAAGTDVPLKALPVEVTTWEEWRARFPQTKVLSNKQKTERDYQKNPYLSYENSEGVQFYVTPQDKRFRLKQPVLGIWTGNKSKAYPISLFNEERTELTDEFEGKKFTLSYNPETKSVRVSQADEGLQWMYSFWFAWYAINPETEVYED